jgi:predicted O-methyltransferase YrrM
LEERQAFNLRGSGFESQAAHSRMAHSRTADLARFIDQAYVRGSVPGESSGALELAPHSVERAQGEALRDLAIAEGAQQTIEVGLALGISALFLCQAVLERGGSHVAVDPFQRDSWDGAGLRTLREAGVEDMVEVIEQDSRLALPRLVDEGRRFDLAFIDGDHRFEGVFIDLYYMTRLVRPGGVVVLDDTWMPSVRMAVGYVERNLGAALEPAAMANAFSWRRRAPWRQRPLRRAVPAGTGAMAVLRLPREPLELSWDEFVPPY